MLELDNILLDVLSNQPPSQEERVDVFDIKSLRDERDDYPKGGAHKDYYGVLQASSGVTGGISCKTARAVLGVFVVEPPCFRG